MEMRRTFIPELTMATGIAVAPTRGLRVYATSFDRNELFVMGVREQDQATMRETAPATNQHEVELREEGEAPAARNQPAQPVAPAPRAAARASEHVARLEDE
jgi:hypothetical protein